MLSDEEKEALRNLKSEYETCDHYSSDLIIELDDAEIILNLIEKQSKEIEGLKDKNKELIKERATEIVYVDKNFVRKDKIKAKIEEFKTVRDTILENEKELNRPMMTYDLKRNDYCEKMLQSLLEKE